MLCTCYICNSMSYGGVCMLYIWYYVHVVLCACGAVYMLYIWFHVQVMLCTHCIGGTMYMWYCVHVVQVVSCTCDVVHMFCRWCFVEVALCMCGTYGTGVHVVLCACHTCCVADMRYYVCALCNRGILTCVFVMLYFVYVYVHNTTCAQLHRCNMYNINNICTTVVSHIQNYIVCTKQPCFQCLSAIYAYLSMSQTTLLSFC